MSLRLLPDCQKVMVDKRDGEWVLTYWVAPETTLRIRIQRTCVYNPEQYVCEIAERSRNHEFREVARFWWDLCDTTPDFDEWPSEWRDDFIQLARVWSVCNEFTEFGHAIGKTSVVFEPSGPC